MLIMAYGCQSGDSDSSTSESNFADTVFTGANIYTVDDDNPSAEAVAISDGKFVFVGDLSGVEALVGPDTRQHNLAGKLVLPGIVDGHTHPGLVASAPTNEGAQLPQTSKAEMIDWLAAYAEDNPDLPRIFLGRFPVALWGVEGPRKEELDAIIPDRPVMLFGNAGHSQWVNSVMLDLMGVDADSPDPVPGLSFFVRDPDGTPTGWIKEFGASPYIGDLLDTDPGDASEKLEQFLNTLVSFGVTSLLDAGASDASYAQVAALETAGRLPLRYEGSYLIELPHQVPIAIDELKRMRRDYGGERLRFNTVKILFDGVSEISTSSVLEPFVNEPDNYGATVIDEETLRDFLLELHQEKIDLHMHVVADGATRVALDAFDAALEINGGPLQTRMTLCHLEVVDDTDIPRFAELGVFANFTPHWNGGFYVGADRTLGLERYNRMYRIQPFLDAGAVVSFSSDITVGRFTHRTNPFFGMQIARNRQEVEGGESAPVREPADDLIEVDDLVRGYTLNGARQLRMSDRLGSITVGKNADLVILDKNIFELDRYEIHTAKPLAVLIDGVVAAGEIP